MFFDLINSINRTGRINRSANNENAIKTTEYIPMVDIVGILANTSSEKVIRSIVLPIPMGVPTSIKESSSECSSEDLGRKCLW